MSPKPGTPVSLVAPAAPLAAQVAATADAGAVESVSSNPLTKSPFSTAKTKVGAASSSSGSSSSSAGPPAAAHKPDPTKKGWIEIVLKDQESTTQGGTRYRITLPDSSVAEGTLDAKGFARVDGFDSGSCKISFPELDEKTWSPK
jgi:hypothetical protein